MKKLLAAFLLLANSAYAQVAEIDLASIGPFAASETFNDVTIDQTTDGIEYVLQMPEAARITTIKFRYGVRTGTPVQHKIGLQGVAVTGRADGSYLTGSGECSATFTPPASTAWNGTYQQVTLTGTACDLTRGQLIAVVLSPVGTPDAGNSSSFTSRVTFPGVNPILDATSEKYIQTIDGGVATKGEFGLIGLLSSTKTYGWIWNGHGADYYTGGKTVATKLRMPGTTCKYEVIGMRFRPRFWSPGASDTITYRLFTGTTVLQDYALDKDSVPTNDRLTAAYFDETSLTELSCGSDYYISVTLSAGSSYVYCGTVATNQDFDTWPMGRDWYYAERTSGAWTEVNTRRCEITPIIRLKDTATTGVPQRTKFNQGQN